MATVHRSIAKNSKLPQRPSDTAPWQPNGTLEIIPSVAQFAGVQRSHIHQVKSGAPESHSGSETPISNPPPFGLLAQRHANHINQSSSIRFVPKASLNIEEDTTNLQELGMNLSGSQDKPTLALTIPRSNQVVYKGFPSATQFLSIQALRHGPLPDRPAFSTQVMIRTRPKTRLLSNPITQPTTFRRSIQRGFRLRGVQPLSHA